MVIKQFVMPRYVLYVLRTSEFRTTFNMVKFNFPGMISTNLGSIILEN